MESAFQIELRVLNPNDKPLKVSGLECDLNIDGKRFASGVAGEFYDIPAYGSAVVPVTVYASVLDMLSSVIAFVQGTNARNTQLRPLRYELVGHVRISSGNSLPRRTLPFVSKGELSLNPAP